MKTQLLSVIFVIGVLINANAQPGRLDESFNLKGIKELTYQQNASADSVVGICLQPDGKLLVALVGSTDPSPTSISVVMRLNANGEIDKTFGVSGKVSVNSAVGINFHHNAITLQNDGKIVLAGHAIIENQPSYCCLVRLNDDGSIDDTFGDPVGSKRSGYKFFTAYPGNTFKTVQVLESNGMILAGGSAESAGSSKFLLTATDQFGTSISQYGGNANSFVEIAFSVLPNTYESFVSGSVVDQITGTWYIAGTVHTNGTSISRFGITALDAATGDLKTNYASGGTNHLPLAIGTTKNDCYAISLTPDSKGLLLAGSTDLGHMMVYKLIKDLNPNLDFSINGAKTYSLPNSTTSKALSITAESGNNVVMAGYSNITSIGMVPTYIKFNVIDGTVVTSFGQNGIKLFTDKQTYGINGLVYSSKLNKYFSAGTFNNGASTDGIVKCFDINGAPHNSFGQSSEVMCYARDGVSFIADVYTRPDGKFWVCGYSGSDGAIGLLNKDGTYDASFSNNLGDDPGVQFISNIISPPPSQPALPNAKAYAIVQTKNNKLLVAGTYQGDMNSPTILFVIRLHQVTGKWVKDNDFGSNGYISFLFGSESNLLHDMILQPDGKILLYGLCSISGIYKGFVTRLTEEGLVDSGNFATNSAFSPGIYIIDRIVGSAGSATKMNIALQPDNKIIGTGPGTDTNNEDVFVGFRLNADGTPDAVFNNNAINAFDFIDAESMTVLLRKDGRIIFGGSKDSSTIGGFYTFVQLKSDGTLDQTFNKTGKLFISQGFSIQAVVNINEDDNGAVVATVVGTNSEYAFYSMGMRISSSGTLDKTFYSNGRLPLTKCFPKVSKVENGSLYIFGQRNFRTTDLDGMMLKVKLGVGPVVKTTKLLLASNMTVQYGDKPFKLQIITNSPAPLTYSIIQSDCATLDPSSGVITINCATIDSNADIIIRVVQPSIIGYTADTAFTTIKVLKGIPRILFTNQGGEIGDELMLSAISSSGAAPVFTQLDGANYIEFISQNTVRINAEGSSTVSAYFPATTNFEQSTITAIISGYTERIPPDANEDSGELVFGLSNNINIDLLINDEAYTGFIEPNSVDLDPSTPSIQDNFFVSPALGLFEIDSTGVLKYTPFTGFIGSGEIYYTIKDSKGSVSSPGTVRVAVVPQVAIPPLKATEMITPNKDGLNEAFVIGYADLEKKNSLKMFDRNGNELFTIENYQNNWEGTLPNGNALENGIYYFYFIEEGDTQRELKGAVEIRR